MIAQKIEREENNVASFAKILGSLTENLNMKLGYWIGEAIYN